MPLLSYDPALTIASGAELGLLAAIVLDARGGARVNPPVACAPLLDRTLIVISGKGGVGRTTVAAALARAAADAGKRVLIAASAPTDRLGHLFGRAPLGPTVTTLGARDRRGQHDRPRARCASTAS